MFENLTTPDGMTRRHFFGHMATTALALPAMQFFGSLQAQAEVLKRNNKSCILLWMGGGPSHMDTWDLKPESEKNGGEFKPIATSAPGVQICEHLPRIAKQFKHLNVIRSLDSKEGTDIEQSTRRWEKSRETMHLAFWPHMTPH